jgi:hypothetical protein
MRKSPRHVKTLPSRENRLPLSYAMPTAAIAAMERIFLVLDTGFSYRRLLGRQRRLSLLLHAGLEDLVIVIHLVQITPRIDERVLRRADQRRIVFSASDTSLSSSKRSRVIRGTHRMAATANT